MTDIYRGKRLAVVKELYRLPSGKEKERIVVQPGDAAAMLHIEGDRCILLRQFRFAIGEWLCEAPAGTL
ncbi:MAG: NUDIX hydrolase, partial [Methanomicrobiales archaeon]|nr:NUDIX hydrolase [Methanomicrobiales archaeon]